LMFREFEWGDLEQCSRVAAQAWPAQEHVTKDSEGWRLMEPYVTIGVEWSNWTCVAHDDSGAVIGLVFGDIRGLPGSRSIRRVFVAEAKAFTDFTLGKYGKAETLVPFLWNFIMTELKLLIGRPEADAEIMLLVLDEKHRGKGIGREMVDRFVNAARKAGAKKVSVYTDDQASNWRFYERYGFRKGRVFHDNWSSFWEGHASNGIRFELKL